jgi:hypothetical protein
MIDMWTCHNGMGDWGKASGGPIELKQASKQRRGVENQSEKDYLLLREKESDVKEKASNAPHYVSSGLAFPVKRVPLPYT